MPPLSVMFKTVSTDCNLDCDYCYYRESLAGSRVHRRIDDRLLETFIPRYMAYVADVRTASFTWQGGEPTLAGIPFFERVVGLQARHAAPGTVIANALQTNGILLDDDWGAFLARYRFLVGISLDGPASIHDRRRRARSGRGSFDLAMRGVDVLRRHGVATNVLCVVGQHNVRHARDLVSFYRAHGFTHVQFIPCMDFQAIEPDRDPEYQISAAEYGEFLVAAFDEWWQEGQPDLSIRMFDNFLQNHVGVPNDICVHGECCDAGLVIEHDGTAYPCDFYVHPGYALGNVADQPLRDILYSPERTAFMRQKHPLPSACQSCQWLAVCRSGCPRNRPMDGEPAPEYFCAAYMRLFAHADARLRDLAARVQRRGRYLHRVRLEPRIVRRREDPCPCGSGVKQGRCCAAPGVARSYVFRA